MTVKRYISKQVNFKARLYDLKVVLFVFFWLCRWPDADLRLVKCWSGGTLNHPTCTVHFHYLTSKSDRAMIQFVLMKWCGVYSNPWFIKNGFRMCTAFHLGTCKFIFIWKVNVFVFLRGKQKSPITNYAKPTLCKECECEKFWCLFPTSWWNFNVVKIIWIFYSLFSTSSNQRVRSTP